MASSYEIAEQIAAQNQWFVQQNALASQIGVNPMAFGGGMGGFGGGAPFMGSPVMASAPGASRSMPGSFNYGNTMGYGYGVGNRAGALAMGGVSMIPAASGIGFGLASMTAGGSWLQPFTNPISGFLAGRSLGLGMAGSTMFAGAAMLPAMAGAHMVNSMVGGAAQGAMVQTALSGFNFINPASRTGTGFSRQDAHAITSQMRELAYVPELLTSMEELTKMVPKLRATGLMQGVTTAREFNTRFKEAISTLRDVSRMLGSSMEEAADFFAHSRSVGMFGKGDVARNAINSQVMMGATNMTMAQAMSLQANGANLATAIGGSRRAGASAITNLATQLGIGVQNGAISQEVLQDMTGMVGPEAQGAAAARLLNLSARLFGSPGGRMLTAGAIRIDENGKAVLDESVMTGLRSGAISMGQLQRMASRNMGNRNLVKAFVGNEERLTMQFAEQGGAAATFGVYSNAMGTRDLDTMKILMKQQGATEAEIEALDGLFRQQMSGVGYQDQLLASIRSNTAKAIEQGAPSAVLKKLFTRIGNKITRPFEEAGDSIRNSVSQTFERNMDDFIGRVVIDTAEATKRRYVQAFAAGGNEFSTLLSQKTTLTGGSTFGGFLGSSALGRAFKGLGGSGASPEEIFRSEARAFGMPGLDGSTLQGQNSLAIAQEFAARGGIAPGFSVGNFNAEERAGALEMAKMYKEMLNSGAMNGLDDAARMELLMKAGGNETPGSRREYALRKAMTSLGTNRGMWGAQAKRALIIGAMQNVPEYLRLTGVKTSVNLSVGMVQNTQRDAADKMSNIFDDPAVRNSLKNSPMARKALLALANTTGDTTMLLEAIRRGDYNAANEEAKNLRLGISFTAESIDVVAGALPYLQKNKAGVQSSLTDLENAETAGMLYSAKNGLLQQAKIAGDAAGMAKDTGYGDLSAGLTAVQNAYQGLAETVGQGDAGATSAAQATMSRAHESLAKMVDKNPKMLASTPQSFQAYYARSRGAGRMLGQLGSRTDAGAIVRQLGGSVSGLIEALGLPEGSEILLTGGMKEKIKSYYGGLGAGSVMSELGQAPTPSPKDQAVINAMKTIAEAVIALSPDEKRREQAQKILGNFLERPSSNVSWGS